MRNQRNLWFIRAYAILIILFATLNILEGVALKIILVILSVAILIQSSILEKKK